METKTIHIKLNELIISEEQACYFASTIFEDIEDYIKQHTDDFWHWLLQDTFKNIILTINGIQIINNKCEYKLCEYVN